MDDFGWSPESDSLETGSVVPIGRINIFMGMIGKSQPTLQFSDSVSKVGTTVHSDGQESVGTMEIESASTTQGDGSGEPAWAPRGEINNDTESILELFEDCYGYEIEEEEFESEPGPVCHAMVYTAPAINTEPV